SGLISYVIDGGGSGRLRLAARPAASAVPSSPGRFLPSVRMSAVPSPLYLTTSHSTLCGLALSGPAPRPATNAYWPFMLAFEKPTSLLSCAAARPTSSSVIDIATQTKKLRAVLTVFVARIDKPPTTKGLPTPRPTTGRQ